MRHSSFVLAAVGAFLASSPVVATPLVVVTPPAWRYVYQELGVDFHPRRISNAGHIVGTYQTQNTNSIRLWSNGEFTELGGGYVFDIESDGRLLWQTSIGGEQKVAIWQGGASTPLPLPFISNSGEGYAMNARGQIVGTIGRQAITWQEGQPSHDVLPGPPGPVNRLSAVEINESGQIAGASEVNFGWRGLVWQDLQVVATPHQPAVDINDRGEVLTHDLSLFRIADGATVPIGGLSDPPQLPGGLYHYMSFPTAAALNDLGQVVGNVEELYFFNDDPHAYLHRAFLWDQVNGTIELARLVPESPINWRDVFVSDINDRGEIIGRYHDGPIVHGFLLTPVPEPSMAVLAALLMAVASGSVFRRRRGVGGQASHRGC